MPLISVASDKFAVAFGSPKYRARHAAAYEQLELVDALTRTFSTDAHLISYVLPPGHPLLVDNKQPRLSKYQTPADVLADAITTAIVIDADNPGHVRWTDETSAEAIASYDRLPLPCGIYHTSHGARFVLPLEEPVPSLVAEPLIRRALSVLDAAGFSVDHTAKDWTRHMRLPNVVRAGRVFRSPYVDLSRMRPVTLEPLELPARARRPSKSRPRLPPIPFTPTLAEHWQQRARVIGATIATSVSADFHKLYLAVGGALLSKQVPPEHVPELVRLVSEAAGSSKPQHHERSARDTVARYLAGAPVTGMRDLTVSAPSVADAVHAALDDAHTLHLLAQPAAPSPPPSPLAETTAALERTIANAPDGLTVIAAECGLGKALSLDTEIPTPDGWMTMGELRVGDTVFDERGEPCNVTFATPVMHDRRCFDVVFDDGTVIVADAAHRWLTMSAKARRAADRRAFSARHGETSRAPSLGPSVVTTAEIRRSLRQRVSPTRFEVNHSIPVTMPIACAKVDLPIDPYALGVWLGDGDSHAATITTADPEIVEGLRRAGLWIGPPRSDVRSRAVRHALRLAPVPPGALACQHRASSMTSALRRLNVLSNKHIPMEYLRASPSQRLALLQGLMDTDGAVSPFGNCEFSVCSERLARDVYELCTSLGIKATWKVNRARLYGRDCGARYRIGFTPRIPVFRLSRKLARQGYSPKQAGRTSQRFIVDVRPRPSVPVRCITVDSPSHLYLASRSFIPTHNTYAAQRVAAARVSSKNPAAKRAPAQTKTSISVDKNELAEQIAGDLAAQGVAVRRIFGPLSVKNSDGSHVCKMADRADPLVRGGQSIREVLCEGRGRYRCPHYDTCTVKDGYEDYPAATTTPRVTVGSHSLLRQLDGAAGSTGILVIDEPPALLESLTVTLEDIHLARQNLRSFQPDYADAMEPILLAAKDWLDEPELVWADVSDTLERPPTEDAKGQPLRTPPLRLDAVSACRYNVPLAATLGKASGALRALHRAMTRADALVRLEAEIDLARIIVTAPREDLALALRREGAVVAMDANADIHMPGFAKVVGYDPPLHRFAAGDGARIERTHIRCGSGNRKNWVAHGRLVLDTGLLSALRAVASWADECAAALQRPVTMGIIAIGLVELALHAAFDGAATVEADWATAKQSARMLAEAHAAVSEIFASPSIARPVLLAHYGATRGLNRLAGVDCLATVGDPWPNLGDVQTEADYLDVDPDERMEAKARAELEQAHGRLRTVHRRVPGFALHVGKNRPGGSGWALVNTSVVSPDVRTTMLPNGRPPAGRPMAPGELQSLVERLGGASAAARAVGCHRRTIHGYLERGLVPPAVASALRALQVSPAVL